jgi:CHAT domain-containing protein/tetratricopeptide (TPR) repeat protein
MHTNRCSAWNRSTLGTVVAWSSETLVGALFLFWAAVSVLGQTSSSAGGAGSCVNMQPGIVVETVAKNSEAEKAGLAEGDVILAWTRGDLKRQIGSPFDLSEVEIEQEPRGQVTLEGTRGESKQSWAMGPGKWDLGTRPNLPKSALSTYEDGQRLAKAGKLAEAVQRWRAAADEDKESRCGSLSSWFLLRAAAEAASGKQWQESDGVYHDALDRAPEDAPEMRATLLRGWAATFRQRNDWPAAQKYETEALEADRNRGAESLAIAEDLGNLGQVLLSEGDLKASQQYHEQALAIRRKLAPGSLDVASSLALLGDLAHQEGDLSKAESYDLESLAIAERVNPGGLEVARYKTVLGYIESDRGDLAKAEKWIREALAIREKLAPDSLDAAGSLNNLGIVEARRGDLDRADEYWSQSLSINEKLDPESLNVAFTLGNLGLVNLRRGDLDKAQDYFQRDLAIEEKISPNSLDTAKSVNNLGLLAGQRGDFAKAEEYYRRALAIKERIGPDSLDVANSIENLGDVAYARGDLSRAEDYYRKGLAIRERLSPGSVEMDESLNGLGNCASDRGELKLAEEYYQRALAILERVAPGSVDLAGIQTSLGTVASQRGDNAKAELYYRQALEIEMRSMPDSLWTAETLRHFVTVELDRRDQAKAEEYDRQELAIRKKLAPESAGYADALATLAGILHEKQQTDDAARLYAEAIDVFDRQLTHLGGSTEVRAGFRAKQTDYYSEYADLLVEQKKPELAFEVLERSRARTLLEMLAGSHVDIRQGADPAMIERERLLQATLTAKTARKITLLEGEHTPEQLASVNREMDEVLSQYQELEGQIRTNSPKYAALTQPKLLRAKEAQQLLDTKTVLLDYALGAKRSLVFVVTPTSLDSYELPKREEVDSTARRAYDLLTSRNRWVEGEISSRRKARLAKLDAEYRKTSAALSRMVLGPVTERLEGKRLLIVADGALQYIPFAALPVPAGDALQAAVPLMAEHEIVNLPSASVLASLRRQASERGTQPTKEVAILADPVFDKNDPRVGKTGKRTSAADKQVGSTLTSESTEQLTRSIQDVSAGTQQAGVGLSRLAFSRREAASIMAITKPGAGMEALDFNASRETALSKALSQYRIVHFATHGLLDNEHPELSGLVLSLVDPDGKPRDGFVDLQDVYNLTIPADLVVLSACETGLGKEISGEGLVGLTRGFMYAGASRVVASLWKVDDVATSELMAEFYKGMLQSGLPPAAALRRAQLEMQKRKRWADPYYWAAFTLQGEWK